VEQLNTEMRDDKPLVSWILSANKFTVMDKFKLVCLVIKRGGDIVNVRDKKQDETPICWSKATQNDTLLFHLLLSNGARVNDLKRSHLLNRKIDRCAMEFLKTRWAENDKVEVLQTAPIEIDPRGEQMTAPFTSWWRGTITHIDEDNSHIYVNDLEADDWDEIPTHVVPVSYASDLMRRPRMKTPYYPYKEGDIVECRIKTQGRNRPSWVWVRGRITDPQLNSSTVQFSIITDKEYPYNQKLTTHNMQIPNSNISIVSPINQTTIELRNNNYPEYGLDLTTYIPTAQTSAQKKPLQTCAWRFYDCTNPHCRLICELKEAVPEKAQMYCEWCSMCVICNEDVKPDNLILCDRCNDGFHTFCLNISLPQGNWYCSKCQKIKRRTAVDSDDFDQSDFTDTRRSKSSPKKDNKKRLVNAIFFSLDGTPYSHYNGFEKNDKTFKKGSTRNLSYHELKQKCDYKKDKLNVLKAEFIKVLQERDDVINKLNKEIEELERRQHSDMITDD